MITGDTKIIFPGPCVDIIFAWRNEYGKAKEGLREIFSDEDIMGLNLKAKEFPLIFRKLLRCTVCGEKITNELCFLSLGGRTLKTFCSKVCCSHFLARMLEAQGTIEKEDITEQYEN